LLVVNKDDDGNITAVQTNDLTTDEAMEFGAIAGALIGFGADGEEGMEAGGIALADEWIHPKDLIALGLETAEAK
jgi:hypothetical protein